MTVVSTPRREAGSLEAEAFTESAEKVGIGLYSGVPCSYLTPLINHAIDDASLTYIGAANEGDAIAIAAGAEIGGRRGVAMLQNSGLGNAVSPLASLTHVFRIPVLLIVTLRGEPGGPPDEPQHQLMGAITGRMLELLQIPWEYFPTEEGAVSGVLARATEHMNRHARPYALLMRKHSVKPRPLAAGARRKAPEAVNPPRHEQACCTRRELLRAIQLAARSSDVIIATTGYTGRELYSSGDRMNQLYMVGSMGCASSFGLGLAVSQPQRRIIVIDGDGAALMRLGAMATIGFTRPPNIVHILLDNAMHESTGGQSTAALAIDFCAVAAACGYPKTERCSTPDRLTAMIGDRRPGLRFIHVPIEPGVTGELVRPEVAPMEVAARLKRFLSRTV